MLREPRGFQLELLDDGQAAIRLRSADALAPPVRRLAWFVVVIGLTGLAALAVLRVPLTVHAGYLAFFAIVLFVVYTDTLQAGVRLQTELRLEGRRLTRMSGLDGAGWRELQLPEPVVLVIDAAPGPGTRRWIEGLGAPCRLVAVAAPDSDALWTEIATTRAVPEGTVVIDAATYDVARSLGEALARGLAVGLFDLASDEPERRSLDELDRPLMARVDALARAIETTPGAQRPWGAATWRDGVGLHIGLRAFGLAGLVVELLVVLPLLGFLFLLSGGNWGIPVLGLGLLGLAFGARTLVDLTPRGAAVRLLNVWLPLGQEQLLSWDEIEQIHVVAERGRVGIRFVTDAGSTFVPTPSRAAARWAVAEIRRYLLELAGPT